MHKSICDEYTVIPALCSYSAVPIGLAWTQAHLQSPNNMDFNFLILMMSATTGFYGALYKEGKLKRQAKLEGWGATKSSKAIQKGQLKAYGTCLAAGMVTSIFLNAVVPEEYNKRVNGIFTEKTEEIPLYYEPE